MKIIDNATFETLATLKTMTIFDLRTYIIDRTTDDNGAPLFTLASAEIRTPSACLEFITANKLVKSGTGASRKMNDDGTERNRTETIDRTTALATTAPNGFELIHESVAVKTTHNGARVHFDVYGKRLFTLFVQNKHVNIAVKLDRLNNYLKYNDADALPFKTEFSVDKIGSLSYGKDCKFIHECSFDTVETNKLFNDDGTEKLTDDGAPVYETVIIDGVVYKFVVNMLTLYGALIPTETPDTDGKPDGAETPDGAENGAENGKPTPDTETENGKAPSGKTEPSGKVKNNRRAAK